MTRRRLPKYPLTCSGRIECEVTAGDDRTDFNVLARRGCFRLLDYDGFRGLVVVIEVKRGLLFRTEALPRWSVLLYINANDLLTLSYDQATILYHSVRYTHNNFSTNPSNQ